MASALFFFLFVSTTAVAQSTSAWQVPDCASALPRDTQVLVVGLLRFAAPKSAKIVKVTDVDYAQYRVFLKGKSSRALHLWLYGMVSPEAPPDLVRSSADFVSRPVRHAEVSIGTDGRGHVAPDKAWRSVNYWPSLVQYYNATPEVAREFDAIIDTACLLGEKGK